MRLLGGHLFNSPKNFNISSPVVEFFKDSGDTKAFPKDQVEDSYDQCGWISGAPAPTPPLRDRPPRGEFKHSWDGAYTVTTAIVHDLGKLSILR